MPGGWKKKLCIKRCRHFYEEFNSSTNSPLPMQTESLVSHTLLPKQHPSPENKYGQALANTAKNKRTHTPNARNSKAMSESERESWTERKERERENKTDSDWSDRIIDNEKYVKVDVARAVIWRVCTNLKRRTAATKIYMKWTMRFRYILVRFFCRHRCRALGFIVLLNLSLGSVIFFFLLL